MAIPLRKSEFEDKPPRGPSFSLRDVRYWSVTTWLIVVNVLMFLLDHLLSNVRAGGEARNPFAGLPLSELGNFSVSLAIKHLQVWRFITFQFLHASPEHLFFNMLSLYFFGIYVESFLGKARYLAFYLICGIAGAGAFVLLWAVHLLVYADYVTLVGASAGVFGVLIAAAQIAPQTRVQLLFPPVILRLRTLAWIFVAFAVVAVVAHFRNAGGEAAHLGGAAAGLLLIRFPRALQLFAPRPKKASQFWKPGDPGSKFFRDK